MSNHKYRGYLQDEINTLAKMIDESFGYDGCVDCGRPMQGIDASHFHNVGGNENIRWNLHIIHASDSVCNRMHGGKKEGFYAGLISRYTQEYADYVKFSIPRDYPRLSITEMEIKSALKVVRAIIRKFNRYHFCNAIQAREKCNQLIGLYV